MKPPEKIVTVTMPNQCYVDDGLDCFIETDDDEEEFVKQRFLRCEELGN